MEEDARVEREDSSSAREGSSNKSSDAGYSGLHDEHFQDIEGLIDDIHAVLARFGGDLVTQLGKLIGKIGILYAFQKLWEE